MKKILFLALLLGSFSFGAKAQQGFGHTNSADVIQLMSESKDAEAQIVALSKQLQKNLDAKTTAFQKAYASYMADAKAGKIAPADQAGKEKALETQYNSLGKAEEDMKDRLSKKRSDLYKPITTKFDEAVKAVAIEKSLHYVFDQSIGGFIPADGSVDITEAVKNKLGIVEPVKSN